MKNHLLLPFDLDLYFEKMTEGSTRRYDYTESHQKWKDVFLERDEDNSGMFLYSI